MLGDISLATNIYIVTGYTDMRKSIDGLCAIVVDYFNAEPNERSKNIRIASFRCSTKPFSGKIEDYDRGFLLGYLMMSGQIK